jgi:hypothetical protein
VTRGTLRWGLGLLLGMSAFAGLASVVSASHESADTPPVGTITIGDGGGYATSLTVTVYVPATDDVGITSMRIFYADEYHDMPYSPSIQVTFPYAETWGVGVTWFDAAGHESSAGAQVTVDTTAPFIGSVFLQWDDAPTDDSVRVAIQNADDDRTQLTHVRLRSNGGAWSPSYPIPSGNPRLLDWAYLDATQGGSNVLGPRALGVQVRNAAGLWSAVLTKTINFSFEERLELIVTGDQRSGHVVTFTPQLPAGAVLPSNAVCYWAMLWGDDQSLYYGNRNDTFGLVETQGTNAKGYCKPWSVTVPWVPYRQFMVVFEAEGSSGEIARASLGASPSAKAFEPGIDSTSRHITSSNIPMVYVLPEDANLIVGVPTTYRAYARGGETLKSTDVWSVQYTDTPERKLGGSSFTFTPRIAGHLTVCWHGGSSRTYLIAACFDPPARYRDSTVPSTSTPVVGFGAGYSQASVPVQVTWSGSDKGWGIASYRLERSVNGGAWSRVSLASATSRTFTERRAYDLPVRYRVRATDKAGNVGAWDYSSTVRPTRIADTSTLLRYSTGWTTVVDPTAYGSIAHESSAGGSSVTYTFSGRSIAWLGEVGPAFGKARVYVDGVMAWVETGADADSPRRLLFRKTWSSVGTHTIKVVVSGTSGRPTLSVDGFAIMR